MRGACSGMPRQQTVPPWLEEGLPQLASTLEIRGEGATVGIARSDHVRTLRREQWIRSTACSAPPTSSGWSSLERGLFEAESWALCHYLLISEERRGDGPSELARFRALLAGGTAPAEAARTALGDGLQGPVWRHVSADEFDSFSVRIQRIGGSAPTRRDVYQHEILEQLGSLSLAIGEREAGARLLERALEPARARRARSRASAMRSRRRATSRPPTPATGRRSRRLPTTRSSSSDPHTCRSRARARAGTAPARARARSRGARSLPAQPRPRGPLPEAHAGLAQSYLLDGEDPARRDADCAGAPPCRCCLATPRSSRSARTRARARRSRRQRAEAPLARTRAQPPRSQPPRAARPDRRASRRSADAPRSLVPPAAASASSCPGLAALIYETAWTREFAFVFGTSELAVATVLAAYMGGLAAGAALAGRFARRLTSSGARLRSARARHRDRGARGAARDRRVALAVRRAVRRPRGAARCGRPRHRRSSTSPARSLILLVPTAMMGATLPLLARHAVRERQPDRQADRRALRRQHRRRRGRARVMRGVRAAAEHRAARDDRRRRRRERAGVPGRLGARAQRVPARGRAGGGGARGRRPARAARAGSCR